MLSLNPVSRRELVRELKGLGFEGPSLVESTSGCAGAVCVLRFPIPTGSRSILGSFGGSCARLVSRLKNG